MHLLLKLLSLTLASSLLANGVCTFFVNGKPNVFNGREKLRNPFSSLLMFLVVAFNKVPLFSKDLITFMIYFISWFVSVTSELLNKDEDLILILLLPKLYTAPEKAFGTLLLWQYYWQYLEPLMQPSLLVPLFYQKSCQESLVSWWIICKGFTNPWNLCIS